MLLGRCNMSNQNNSKELPMLNTNKKSFLSWPNLIRFQSKQNEQMQPTQPSSIIESPKFSFQSQATLTPEKSIMKPHNEARNKLASFPKAAEQSFNALSVSSRYCWSKGQDEKPLGSGYTATVYRGLDLHTGDPVAIKHVPKEKQRLLASDKYYKKIYRRLPLYAHQNVLRFREFLEDDLSFYLISDLCKGPDLVDFVLEFGPRTVPLEAIRSLISQILLGLHHLNSHGFLHRDLKLDNILFTNEKRTQINIVDFDMSLMLDDPEPPRPARTPDEISVVGTKDYMAPEAYKGEYSFASDLWSLGVILYILLDGHFPFSLGESLGGREIREILRKGVSVAPEVVQRCPAAVDLMLKLLKFNVSERIGSAAEALNHPWISGKSMVQPIQRSILFSLPRPAVTSTVIGAFSPCMPLASNAIPCLKIPEKREFIATPPQRAKTATYRHAKVDKIQDGRSDLLKSFPVVLGSPVNCKTRFVEGPRKQIEVAPNKPVFKDRQLTTYTTASSNVSTLASSYERHLEGYQQVVSETRNSSLNSNRFHPSVSHNKLNMHSNVSFLQSKGISSLKKFAGGGSISSAKVNKNSQNSKINVDVSQSICHHKREHNSLKPEGLLDKGTLNGQVQQTKLPLHFFSGLPTNQNVQSGVSDLAIRQLKDKTKNNFLFNEFSSLPVRITETSTYFQQRPQIANLPRNPSVCYHV